MDSAVAAEVVLGDLLVELVERKVVFALEELEVLGGDVAAQHRFLAAHGAGAAHELAEIRRDPESYAPAVAAAVIGLHGATSGSLIGLAVSKARAARSTSASAKRGPTMCSPTGSPDLVKPQGMEAAGWPVRLKG